VKRRPRWIDKRALLFLHDESLAMFGGAPGLRDEGLLDSALGRAPNQWHYDKAVDLADLAAAYGFGVAKNHAFVDGNKPIAFMSMMAFLRLNGIPFAPEPAHATAIILSLAAGEVSEESLTRWIRDNWPKS